MKFTKEEKIAYAKEYLRNGTADPPPLYRGKRDTFESYVREWGRMLKEKGEGYFDKHYRVHSVTEKLEVIGYAERRGRVQASLHYGIRISLIDGWLLKFRRCGIDGLKSKKKGRPPKMPRKKKPDPVPGKEADSSELDKALARIAELEAKIGVLEKERENDRTMIDFLKKAQALTEKGRKRRR